ncbi:transglutaminase-like cysteine peptidase [Sphingomonas sp. LHG3406-1]|uniref:transglutaminase-like cysteine peptidase n=1 Tax=Sphingomonas sp. LHG3406-1 TaxID=2804617 RepID=UPI002632F91B|nr:transglutaminase-like cysteine peptidase [Sphingomonas sp. LHG3406-1]
MDKSLATVLGFAAAALLAPAAASAQTAASPYAVSANAVRKSEALLGTSSRLAELMAQQQGVAIAATAAATPALPAAPTPAVLRSPYSDRPITVRRAALETTERPDVFGSVALAIPATPLDRRWQAVAGRPADADSVSWAAGLRGRGDSERIDAVNRFVNARIAFVDDDRQFGRADVWQSAAESLRRGRGDCEDYAIAKRELLRAAGFADRDLYLVILKDLVRRSDHAVLVVASGGRLLVLDNGTDRIVDAADVTDYRPIFSYSAGRRWTHGYRRQAEPPMVLASVTSTGGDPLPVPAAAPVLMELEWKEPVFTISAADLLSVPLD